MIIGLTGNVGSGKSQAAKIFKKLGFTIIDADKIGHDILKKEAKKAVIKAFGKEILKGKEISRKKLGLIVFSDKSKLKKLNKISHPLMLKKIKQELKSIKNKNIIIEAAILIEANWHKICDKVIVVKISRKNQLKRAKSKGIGQIIKSQMPQGKKLKYADFIIDNNKPLSSLKKQVMKIKQNI